MLASRRTFHCAGHTAAMTLRAPGFDTVHAAFSAITAELIPTEDFRQQVAIAFLDDDRRLDDVPR